MLHHIFSFYVRFMSVKVLDIYQTLSFMSFPFCFSFRVWQRVFLMSLARIPVGAMNIFLLCHLYHLLEHFTTHYSRNKIVLTFHFFYRLEPITQEIVFSFPLLSTARTLFHTLLKKQNHLNFSSLEHYSIPNSF